MIVTLVFKHRIVHFLKDNVRKPGQVLIAVRYFNFHTSKSEEIVVCECQYGVFLGPFRVSSMPMDGPVLRIKIVWSAFSFEWNFRVN